MKPTATGSRGPTARRGIALCLALAATTPAQGPAGSTPAEKAASTATPRVEAWSAPDGSRFLLAPDTGAAAAPVVQWVVSVPASFDEDPLGALGLSRAVVRASLLGTWSHGSSDSAAEQRAIAELDAALAEVSAQRRRSPSGPMPDGLVARVATASQAARSLGDPDEWLRALSRVPATTPEIREVPGATLIGVATPTSGLGQVAQLWLDWRENAALRGYHDTWDQVSLELRALAESPSGRLRREVLGTTFLGAAAARRLDELGSFVPYADAQRQRTRIVHPLRSTHVLTGGFDPTEVKRLLAAVFAKTGLPPPAFPAPLRAADARAHRSVLAPIRSPRGGAAQGVALAWPLPIEATAMEVEALVALLNGTSFAYLPRLLDPTATIELAVEGPFPATARDGLLLIEAVVNHPTGPTGEDLEQALVARLAALPSDFRRASADLAVRLANGRRIVATATPHDLAFALANGCGARGEEPAAVLPTPAGPDSDRMRGLVDRIFGEGPLTVVVLGSTR